jgi:hypothetical protein
VNVHIDSCMTNPQKGKEEAKRRQIESKFIFLLFERI